MTTPPMAFIGRRHELRTLESCLGDAAAGRGGVVMVVGEPGIGKTWTARAFADRARTSGAVVHWGACVEDDLSRPYAPWVEALDAYARRVAPDRLGEELGAGAAPVAQLLPAVQAALPDVPPAAPLDREDGRFRLFDAVTQ